MCAKQQMLLAGQTTMCVMLQRIVNEDGWLQSSQQEEGK